MVNNTEGSKQHFKLLVTELYEKNQLPPSIADNAIDEFSIFISAQQAKLNNFRAKHNRLDTFFAEAVASDDQYRHLWIVIKMALILSHGNASVESGFSVNKHFLIENLHEQSLIAQRLVYDGVKSSGGPNVVEVTKEMRSHAKLARGRYRAAIEARATKENEIRIRKMAEKRKRAQVKVLEAKKQKLSKDTASAFKALDEQIRLLT